MKVGLNKGTRLIWGQWDLNPRPPAPQANTSARLSNFNRDGILDQARRWPLRLRQIEFFLNVEYSHKDDSDNDNLRCFMTGMSIVVFFEIYYMNHLNSIK